MTVCLNINQALILRAIVVLMNETVGSLKFFAVHSDHYRNFELFYTLYHSNNMDKKYYALRNDYFIGAARIPVEQSSQTLLLQHVHLKLINGSIEKTLIHTCIYSVYMCGSVHCTIIHSVIQIL